MDHVYVVFNVAFVIVGSIVAPVNPPDSLDDLHVARTVQLLCQTADLCSVNWQTPPQIVAPVVVIVTLNTAASRAQLRDRDDVLGRQHGALNAVRERGDAVCHVTLNTAIFRRVRRRASRRHQLDISSGDHRPTPPTAGSMRHHSPYAHQQNPHPHIHHNHHSHHQQQPQQPVVGGVTRPRDYNVTVLLLVVSTTFVVLNVPYCVSWTARRQRAPATASAQLVLRVLS